MKLIQLFGKSLLAASGAFALAFTVSCEKADEPTTTDEAAPAPAEEAAPPAEEAAPPAEGS